MRRGRAQHHQSSPREEGNRLRNHQESFPDSYPLQKSIPCTGRLNSLNLLKPENLQATIQGVNYTEPSRFPLQSVLQKIFMAEAATPETHGLLSSDLPPLPENRIVVGFGMVSVDYVAIVDAFPKPDEKVRARNLQVLGGGNASNALTCASRLGLKPKLITKVSDDSLGQRALAELEADGVDTSLVNISKGGTSTSTYVIIDKQTNSRTCIYTLGVPAMVPDDLPKTKLLAALSEAKLVYFDGRSTKPALVVAQKAAQMGIPILVEAERKKDGLGGLLDLATYVICSEKFPQAWASVSSIPSALVSILLNYPAIKFVIATLGEKGCLMIDRRTVGENPHLEAVDVDSLIESLKLKIDESATTPTFVASESSVRLRANGIGVLYGKLLLGTADKIPPSEILDTTGAGDAFIGAVLYALCAGMPPEKMLPFACQVAAISCRAVGARTGLPFRADPRLAPFLY